jgi:alpha-galactosidase
MRKLPIKPAFLLGLLFFYACEPQKTIWISDLDLTTMECGWGEGSSNKNIEGDSLQIAGQRYPKGIGAHAPSEFEINLNGQASKFTAYVGVEDGAAPYSKDGATVKFKIVIDNEVAFESPRLKYGNKAIPVDIDIKKGAKSLLLIVEDAGDGSHGDHACWAMPQITYNGEKAPEAMYTITEVEPYILTPPAPETPMINGADMLGARTGHDIIYKIPATGKLPLSYNATNLPSGLWVDKQTGIIKGRVYTPGNHYSKLIATNELGSDTLDFTFVIGNQLCLTPPMGFNTWNAYGTDISQEKIMAIIDAFEKTGLINYGWSYINIDDGWSAQQRNANGVLLPNEKFPDMRKLADYAHEKGLKLGIYSSPGATTCGGFPGSLGYEETDVNTWSQWGIDYLKYDWCSYNDEVKDKSLTELAKPYITMQRYLEEANRDIIFSMCQYGTGKVWEWGAKVGGNLWRTTGDITDTWGSLKAIGFSQVENQPYAKPGSWNDPDMLVVGNLGWGKELRPTRLNAHEQYTHITLWSILAAPLLIGCDLTNIDDFTLNLLKNREVIAINQDGMGIQGKQIIVKDKIQVWTKPLSNGDMAVAVFNLGLNENSFELTTKEIGQKGRCKAMDVWTYKEEPESSKFSFRLPPHGTKYLRLTPLE